MTLQTTGNYLEWYLGTKTRVAWDRLVFLVTFLPVIVLAPASQPSVSVGEAQQPSFNRALEHSTLAGQGAAEAHFHSLLKLGFLVSSHLGECSSRVLVLYSVASGIARRCGDVISWPSHRNIRYSGSAQMKLMRWQPRRRRAVWLASMRSRLAPCASRRTWDGEVESERRQSGACGCNHPNNDRLGRSHLDRR